MSPLAMKVVALILYWEPVPLIEKLRSRNDLVREHAIAEKLKEDALNLAKFFRDELKYGENVHTHALLAIPDAERKLESVIDWLLWNFDRNENLLILYYGGHADNHWGLQAVASQTSNLYLTAPPLMINIQRYVERLTQGSANILVILDCCYAGGILTNCGKANEVKRNAEGILEVIEKRLRKNQINPFNHNVHFVVSCSKGAPTSAGMTKNTFTRAFIEECREYLQDQKNNNDVEIETILQRVDGKLSENPISRQICNRDNHCSIILPVLTTEQPSFSTKPCQGLKTHVGDLKQWLSWLSQLSSSTADSNDLLTQLEQLVTLCEFEYDLTNVENGPNDTFEPGKLGQLALHEMQEINKVKPMKTTEQSEIALQAVVAFLMSVLRGISDLNDRLHRTLSAWVLLESWDRTETPDYLARIKGAWIMNLAQQAQAKAITETGESNLSDDIDFRFEDKNQDENGEGKIVQYLNSWTESFRSRKQSLESKTSDIPNIEYCSGSYRTEGCLREVLIEFIGLEYMKRAEKQEMQRLKLLIEVLKLLDKEQFRLLPCLGYVQDEEAEHFGLVFELRRTSCDTEFEANPEQLRFERGPIETCSLRDALQMKHFCPSPESRSKAAFSLARALGSFHTIGRLHKGIQSSNVRLIVTKDKGQDGRPELESPWLLGFSFSRDESNDSLRFASRAEHDVYNHPDRWGSRPKKYEKLHDIYSLGVLLLEIGSIQVVEEFHGLANWRKWKDGVSDPVKLPKFLGLIARDHISRMMGKDYSEATKACLSVTEKDSPLSQARPEELSSAFREHVLNRLRGPPQV